MISKIGKTMLLIVGVIKLFSMLSADEVKNGINFAGAFLGFVIAYLAISNLAGDKIDSVGKMVKSIVVSMGLMIGVAKLAGTLSLADMINGTGFALTFAIFVGALVTLTKSNEKVMDGLSKLLLSVSFSMLLMIGVTVDEKLFIERPIHNSLASLPISRSKTTPHLYYHNFPLLNTQFHIRMDIVRYVCTIVCA